MGAPRRRALSAVSVPFRLSFRSSHVTHNSPAAAAPQSGVEPLSAQTRLALVLLLAAAFVVFLNETTMSVAIPEIMDDLEVTPALGQWLTTAFALTMAVVIPITGWLLQRLNTRPVFILAMVLFTAGTLLAAVFLIPECSASPSRSRHAGAPCGTPACPREPSACSCSRSPTGCLPCSSTSCSSATAARRSPR